MAAIDLQWHPSSFSQLASCSSWFHGTKNAPARFCPGHLQYSCCWLEHSFSRVTYQRSLSDYWYELAFTVLCLLSVLFYQSSVKTTIWISSVFCVLVPYISVFVMDRRFRGAGCVISHRTPCSTYIQHLPCGKSSFISQHTPHYNSLHLRNVVSLFT